MTEPANTPATPPALAAETPPPQGGPAPAPAPAPAAPGGQTGTATRELTASDIYETHFEAEEFFKEALGEKEELPPPPKLYEFEQVMDLGEPPAPETEVDHPVDPDAPEAPTDDEKWDDTDEKIGESLAKLPPTTPPASPPATPGTPPADAPATPRPADADKVSASEEEAQRLLQEEDAPPAPEPGGSP